MWHVPTLLRENREFRNVFAAHSISLIGDQIALIALPLTAVLVLDANAAQMGYLTAAGLVPYLLFSLHAGAWVDRSSKRRRTMIAADIGRALVVATVPVAYWLDVLTIEQLLVTEFLIGSMAVLFSVANTVLFVSVVPRERYVEGQSLLNGSRAFSYVAGPTLGGLLVQALTAPATLVLDACSYVFSAFFLRSDRSGRAAEARRPSAATSSRGCASSGTRRSCAPRSWRRRPSTSSTSSSGRSSSSTSRRELGISPGTLGLVLGAGAVGGLIGSVITGPIGRRIGIGPAFVVGCIGFPAPLVLVPLAEGPDWVIVSLLFLAEFGSGIGVMMIDISAGAMFAALIPHRLRARVSGAYSTVNYGVRPLGSLVGGALGTTHRAAADALDRLRRRAGRRALAPTVADSPAARAA